MSILAENVKIPYASEGVIRTAAIDDPISPENSVQLAVNMNFDRIGAIQTRPGVQLFLNFSNPIIAFGTYANFATPSFQLLSQAGSTGLIIYADGNPKRTLTVANKSRFAQYLNLTWMVNGESGDAVQTYDGTSFGTTMVPASFPKGDFIQAGFEGRVWVGIKSLDIIYFTDVVQFTPPSTYSLTFDASINFIKNFSSQNGETMTAIYVTPRALLVFKQNSIYRVYGAYSADSYPAYQVGTYSQESIVETKDGIYFHHSSGFYKFSYDSQPVEISRRIIDFVKAISRSNYENVCGVWDGYDAIEWSVGTVTVEGVTFTNCVLRYTISTQVWTVYDYNTTAIKAMIRFDNGTTITPMAGFNNGYVGKLGVGNLDFSNSFYYEFIDRWRSYSSINAQIKNISGVNLYSENAAGANVFFQKQKSGVDAWGEIGTVNEDNNSLFPNAQTEDFDVGRFRLVGNTKGAQVVVHGIEILSIQDKGFDSN